MWEEGLSLGSHLVVVCLWCCVAWVRGGSWAPLHVGLSVFFPAWGLCCGTTDMRAAGAVWDATADEAAGKQASISLFSAAWVFLAPVLDQPLRGGLQLSAPLVIGHALLDRAAQWTVCLVLRPPWPSLGRCQLLRRTALPS